ncbi:MAG: hypothetical protein KA175_02040 [Flavobacteriales bacterium]|nr:hypothetical protein [Flavobacteriales bacterium]
MRHATLLPFFAFAAIATAQPQLDNPGFETWQNVGTATEEPEQWSSVKTSDGGTLINNLAPQMVWQSADAHSGSWSANLRTVSSILGAATGLLTNGRVHAELQIENSYVFTDSTNSDWNTACASRPDSLIGWFKYAPLPGDKAVIGVLLHVDDGKLPGFGTEPNWVGGADWESASATVATWERISVPFYYIDNRAPEYLLMIMTTGDSTNSQVGTEAWFDDLGLIYNVYATPDAAIAYVTAIDGFDLNVAYATGGEPVGAVDFTAELSDLNGDFTNAVAIGTLNSTSSSGSIACTIPAGTVPGTGYRIRVNTPSPYYAPVDSGIVVELSTGLQQISSGRSRIYINAQGLVVDLSAAAFAMPRYDIIAANGQVVGQGSLVAGSMNVHTAPVQPGIYTVRLHHANGFEAMRVAVPIQ